MRSAASSLSVDCLKLKIGISSDSTTGVATGVYYGKDGDCNSSWNNFFSWMRDCCPWMRDCYSEWSTFLL